MIPIIIDLTDKNGSKGRRNKWLDQLNEIAFFYSRVILEPIFWENVYNYDCRIWLSQQLTLLEYDNKRSIVFVHSNNWWDINYNDDINLVTLAQQHVNTLFIVYSGNGSALIPNIQNQILNIHIFPPIINRDGSIATNDQTYLNILKMQIAREYYGT